jgi:hypothetical protein
VLLKYFNKNVKQIDRENGRNSILLLRKPDKVLAQAGREGGEAWDWRKWQRGDGKWRPSSPLYSSNDFDEPLFLVSLRKDHIEDKG